MDDNNKLFRSIMLSSSDSTYSRLSSCSSHDSIQHWVDSLDDNDNDVVVLRGHEVGAGQQHGAEQMDNIPGYGQQLPKKGMILKSLYQSMQIVTINLNYDFRTNGWFITCVFMVICADN